MKIKATDKMKMAGEVSEILKAIANPHRLLIMCKLIDDEVSVGILAEELGVRGAVASQHLSILRRSGIVATRRDGQTIYYKISDKRVRSLIETLYRKFCQSA
jgi:DNA-binding transcriptional ArsR family regulator